MTGCDCPHPYAQADTLAWHDSYSLREIAKSPPVSIWRRIAVDRTSRRTARAVFVVGREDSPGRGLLDLFCGGGKGNAVAHFTVTG